MDDIIRSLEFALEKLYRELMDIETSGSEQVKNELHRAINSNKKELMSLYELKAARDQVIMNN